MGTRFGRLQFRVGSRSARRLNIPTPDRHPDRLECRSSVTEVPAICRPVSAVPEAISRPPGHRQFDRSVQRESRLSAAPALTPLGPWCHESSRMMLLMPASTLPGRTGHPGRLSQEHPSGCSAVYVNTARRVMPGRNGLGCRSLDRCRRLSLGDLRAQPLVPLVTARGIRESARPQDRRLAPQPGRKRNRLLVARRQRSAVNITAGHACT